MSLSALEHSLHELQTEWFINRNPIRLGLRRPTEAPDGAGGILVGLEEDLPLQTVRVVTQINPPVIVTEEGRQIRVDVAVVGMPYLDIKEGDHFDWQEHLYEVVEVVRHPFWATKGYAQRRG